MSDDDNTIVYTPPPILREFIKDYRPGELFYDWIVGPVGSGKTTAIFMKLVRMAKLQKPSRDGIRRTRAVIVRNTMPQLRDTTLSSWNYWFKDGEAGKWFATPNKFTLMFDDVECEVLFRPLDSAEDVARVLSLEVTFAILDEFVEIKREIVDALSARCGRYPSKKDGGATNWGMWGSSNPSTEDNWWFDFLHNGLPDNARYFLQPSGFSDGAENIENLPGGAAYYTNQAKGKSEAWIKQFLEAEWGFSISGKPVVPTFKTDMHVAKARLNFNKALPLVIGVDPGLGGGALIMGQEDLHSRLLVLGEIITENFGAERLIVEKLNPYLRRHFPGADVWIAPDPAAANRAQTDEKAVVDVFRKHFPGRVKIETNNRLAKRFDAIEHFSARLTDVGPALLIDPVMCPVIIRALKGGWKFVIDPKREITKPEPEKNQYSHPGDAFGYLCRYFHRGHERGNNGGASARFVPPRSFGSNYHMR
jgi:hypothetical protein